MTMPTAIHWRGLRPPIATVHGSCWSKGPAKPIGSNFPVLPATHWMHSHQGLQEAFLLAAPLMVRDPADQERDGAGSGVFLSDFSFTHPRKSTPDCAGTRRGCQ